MGSGKIKLKAPDQSSKLIMEFGGVQKLEKRKRRVERVEASSWKYVALDQNLNTAIFPYLREKKDDDAELKNSWYCLCLMAQNS